MQHDCSFVRYVLSQDSEEKKCMADTAATGIQAGGKGSTISRWVSLVQMDGLVAQSLYLTKRTSKNIFPSVFESL